MTYKEASAMLSERKATPGYDRPRPIKIDNNTFLSWACEYDQSYSGPDIVIRLHRNPIVVLHPDGSYTLSDGGWRTSLTRRRINDLTPYYVTDSWNVWVNDQKVPFRDGMTVEAPNGPCVSSN